MGRDFSLRLRLDVMSKFPQRNRIIPSEFDEGWILEIDGEVQSHVDLQDPRVIRFEYLRRIANVFDLCWPPTEPISILHLGAGALTLARYAQATRPGSHQTVIELDPELIPLVTTWLPLPEGTDLAVITGDARTALQDLDEQRFDAMIVDIFTGHDTATHLTDKSFYRDLLQCLSARGVLLVNIGDDEGLAFFGQQAQTLHTVAVDAGLPGAWTLADASTLNGRLAGNAVLATGPGLRTEHEDMTALRSRLEAAGPHPGSVLIPTETARFSENIAG